MADQDRTPYVDALIAYSGREPTRLHVPGHRGGPGADPALSALAGEAALRHDIPALIHGIDVGDEPTPFQQAQLLAAEAWGARRSWFLLNGASQGNQAACLTLAHSGREVVVQRNVHSSVIDGLIVGGLRPTFVAPEVDPQLGIVHVLTPGTLAEALDRTPGAVGALVVSPTYFGACADIAGLAEVTHARGLPLVVDEAWGAHLHFHPDLPPDALGAGADLVVSSTHKTVGSLTQASMIHLGSDRIDEHIVDRCISLMESTSPSGLLAGSLDAARRLAAVRGRQLLDETLAALTATREQIRSIPGLDVLDQSMVGRAGVAGWDPLRLSIDVRGTGHSGYRVGEVARTLENINFELASENVLVSVFGIGAPAAPAGERLVRAMRNTVEKLEADTRSEPKRFAHPPPWGELVLTPRDAFLGRHETVPFDAAEGRVAAEPLAAYPPGIPNVLPGERMTRETLDYITASIAHGGFVRGAVDRELRTLRVVADD